MGGIIRVFIKMEKDVMKRRDFCKGLLGFAAGASIFGIPHDVWASDNSEADSILGKYGISLNDVREDSFYSGLRLEENILGRDLSSEKDFYLSLKDRARETLPRLDYSADSLRKVTSFLKREAFFVPSGISRANLSDIFVSDEYYGNCILGDCDTSSILIKSLYESFFEEGGISLSHAPGHAFLKGDNFNFESLDDSTPSDEDYLRDYDIHNDSVSQGVYLSKKNDQQLAAHLLLLSVYPLFRKREFPKLIDILVDAKKLDSKNPWIYGVMADSYFIKKDYYQARGWYRRCLNLDPNDDCSRRRLGEIEQIIG